MQSEATETSVRAFNRVALLAGFVFLSPTVFLDLIGAAYDPWIRVSHLTLAVAGFGIAWVTRPGAKTPLRTQLRLMPPYVVGVNLSQVMILQRLREPLDVTPALLTIVVVALLNLPVRWFVVSVALQAVSILIVASARGWQDPWISVVLVSMAVIAVFSAVFLNRRVHRTRMESLRAQQLASAAALEREMEARARLQEREIANEKLQGLGRLAGGVAHDLNNLLVPIMGNVDLLLGGAPTDDQRDRLEKVMDAVERARLLTRQLTTYAGKGGATDEVFDLVTEVTETRRLVLGTVPRPLSISWEPPGDPVWISGDRAQVQQALLNLLLNAAEAVADVSDPVVHLRLAPSGEASGDGSMRRHARLTVRDEGPGIPDEDLGRVFDPFFTTKGAGRGLGLSAALGAVQRQGGELTVRNAETGGAEFVLLFRTVDAPPEGESETTSATEGVGRVLLVDDDALVRDVGRQTLTQAGFVVETAESGGDAVAVAAAGHAFDAAVVDLRMPGMDGRTTIDELRRIDPSLAVVICTGYGAEAAGWSEELDRIDVVTKPYRRTELVAALGRLLNGGAN